jgi:hypothetical protein
MSEVAEQNERKRYAEIMGDEDLSAGEAVGAIFKEYSRERPEVVALWCFGVGFVLGWKLRIF